MENITNPTLVGSSSLASIALCILHTFHVPRHAKCCCTDCVHFIIVYRLTTTQNTEVLRWEFKDSSKYRVWFVH